MARQPPWPMYRCVCNACGWSGNRAYHNIPKPCPRCFARGWIFGTLRKDKFYDAAAKPPAESDPEPTDA